MHYACTSLCDDTVGRLLTWAASLGILHNMKSFNVRHIQHRLAAVLAEVEAGEEIEVVRRGRPVARIVPLRAAAPPCDWSHAADRLREAYPEPVGGIAAADLVADGRGER